MVTINNLSLTEAKPTDYPHLLLWNYEHEAEINQLAFNNNAQIGLKMDFFGEALLSLRRDNRFYQYAQEHTDFDYETVQGRDETAILKTASGFLKILYPHLQLTLQDYQRDCLEPAKEIRQYIRNLQYHLDDEYKKYGKNIYVDVK